MRRRRRRAKGKTLELEKGAAREIRKLGWVRARGRSD